jgi:hypothetical protein
MNLLHFLISLIIHLREFLSNLVKFPLTEKSCYFIDSYNVAETVDEETNLAAMDWQDTKGILVSTADYGPAAYNFAKDKPLTLLNGNNLLHLLQTHGHKAKIDLKEAKMLMNNK